ncbi:hypothetical protein Q3G72_011620 [Acer saccharum]|nr:hypothetical protein Q3G72_011620 [Acer saccharum]
MEAVRVLVTYGGSWETNSEGFYRFSRGKTKGIMVPLNSNYIDLVDRTVYRAENPTEPVNILNDDDVAFFLCETNALPIQQRTTLAITISQISTDAPITQVAEYPSYFFHGDHDERNPMGFNEDTTFNHFSSDPFTEKNNVVMTQEDVNIVGDDCADTEEDGHANTMGDDFANPNVNPLASDPELRQEDNVPMSNPISRVVNLTVPPSSKTSLVAIDGNIDIEMGGLYHCKKQLRLHLGMVAMTKKFQYHVKRSTTDRFEAACIHNHCKWRIRATKLKNSDYFEVKRYDASHLCNELQNTGGDHRQASSWIIGHYIKSKFEGVGCNYRPKEIIADIHKLLGLNISYEKAWRARESAFDEVRGSPEESYAQLPSYCYMLEKNNPGTATKIEVDNKD